MSVEAKAALMFQKRIRGYRARRRLLEVIEQHALEYDAAIYVQSVYRRRSRRVREAQQRALSRARLYGAERAVNLLLRSNGAPPRSGKSEPRRISRRRSP